MSRLIPQSTHAVALGMAVAVVVSAGCAAPVGSDGARAPSPSAASAPNIGLLGSRSVGPMEFSDVVAEPARLTINVHAPFEGDIAGTDLSIPFDQIELRLAALPSERTTPLAIYCRTGRMSTIAMATLTSLGYLNVIELQGGMRAWEATGRPLEWR